MKKIICYGDSNTFGYNPKDNSRFDENTRWPAVLQKNLGPEYEVLNEGACNRTGFVTNSDGDLFSAQKHFPQMLSKFDHIDILILAIGTNDLQFQYDISFETVEKGLENLIKLAKEKTENIIIIPPVVLSEKILEGFFRCQFDEKSVTKSQKEIIAQGGNVKKNLRKLNIAQMSGIAYSAIMLGVLLPKLNIWMTRGKRSNKK